MEERSVERAINRYDRHRLPSGQILVVKIPEKKVRWDSYSRQNQRGFRGNASDYPTCRDSDPNLVSFHPSIRNNTMSYRQFIGTVRSTANSSMVQSPPRSLPAVDVQTQFQPRGYACATSKVPIETAQPIPVKHWQSSITEVLQHQSALNRFDQQAPLNSIENKLSPFKRLINLDEAVLQDKYSSKKQGGQTFFGSPVRHLGSWHGPGSIKENSSANER